MRRIITTVTSLLVCSLGAGLLSGCSVSSAAADDCTPAFAAGEVTNAVRVSGSFGEVPDVTFPAPIYGAAVEREVIIPGDGELVRTGDYVQLQFALFDGMSGELVQSSYDSPAGSSGILLAANDSTGKPSGLTKALNCTPVGSRVLLAVDLEFLQIDPNTVPDWPETGRIVLVADLVSRVSGRAEGAHRPLPAGFPGVVTAPDGRPGVTLARTSAPAKTRTAASILGRGATVQEGDSVTVQLLAVTLNDEQVLQSTWADASPGQLPTDGSNDIGEQLVGYPVGSQVVIMVPETGGTTAEPTVYVVDILDIR